MRPLRLSIFVPCVLLVLTGMLSSCSTPRPATRETAPEPKRPTMATNAAAPETLVLPVAGKVASVNSALGFAVLDFSLGGMPVQDQRLHAYRNGQKVAELRVSGPQLGGLIIADMVAGTVLVGDQVRSDH